MKPKFEPTKNGFEIIDPIERHRHRVVTHKPISLKEVGSTQLQYPVDKAVEFTAEMISLPANATIYIRNRDGSMVAEASPSQPISLPKGKYTLDISVPLKIYIKFDGEVSIYADNDQTHVIFGDTIPLTIGARSYHTRPADTIKTTKDPLDIMRAVSAFGSALKTTTAERSYPTLRGHPPAIKLCDELEIPNSFEKPETGIRIEIPADFHHIFTITPLAYYLGADIAPNEDAKITTVDGYSYDMGNEFHFDTRVRRLLKKIFFLDCVVRTEGLTPLPLHQRGLSESDIGFDIGKMYHQPLASQIKSYLDIPFHKVSPYLPEWRLTTQLRPNEESIEFLPFIANRLSPVSIHDTVEKTSSKAQTSAIKEFSRGSMSIVRGKVEKSNQNDGIPTDESIVQQSWESEDSSTIVSTTPLSAFYNNIGRSPKEDPIEIDVICNDPNMQEELETVNEVYNSQEDFPFDVTLYHNIRTGKLQEVLTSESDFLHYIGHIDSDGFQCLDGKLDASKITKVGVKAFLLNACQSYNQGLHLVEAGSIGGIVTLNEIVNKGAISVGSTIAGLLNQGFPLYAALDIARGESVVGEQYRVVGDGVTTIAQSKNGVPSVCMLSQKNDDFIIEVHIYESSSVRKGSLFTPYVEPADEYYLTPGKTGKIVVTKSQIEEFFDLEDIPVIIDGSVQWSRGINIDDL
ncbi:hypothetical protein [Natronorubrum tibetense]|uniref:CHAT domain-containing protein n=1 Tax=Natronorubrum tibetense GA33 TaxID=1114856 RepID=L9WBU0_9EURY|nr:hypothetical protein [Natronorubrum tibetense]ELY46827.1 hypothetical protein C496_00160 [Natronorubrum tibetense GA33]